MENYFKANLKLSYLTFVIKNYSSIEIQVDQYDSGNFFQKFVKTDNQLVEEL